MRIGELAKQSGIPASTIRFYEEQGLLPRADRTLSGYRVYTLSTLEKLQLIKFAQKLGFSLQELPKLLNHEQAIDHELVMNKLSEKQSDLEQLIEGLMVQKESIKSLKLELSNFWNKGTCLPTEKITELLKSAKI